MEAMHSVFRNIWLVDDDEDDRIVFEEAVKEIVPFTEITTFSNGEELLRLLDLKVPDVVFLDINMPALDGMSCLKLIREKHGCGKLPVIMFTISKHKLDVSACYGYGATLYFVKPPSQRKLVEQLTLLFQLNWNDPEEITDMHFVGNRFVPFSAE